DVVVERIHHHAERKLLLELGRPAAEDEKAPLLGQTAGLGEQPGLTDPGLPAELEHPGRPRLDLIEGALDLNQLMLTPDDLGRLWLRPHRCSLERDYALPQPSVCRFGWVIKGSTPYPGTAIAGTLARIGGQRACQKKRSSADAEQRFKGPARKGHSLEVRLR